MSISEQSKVDLFDTTVHSCSAEARPLTHRLASACLKNSACYVTHAQFYGGGVYVSDSEVTLRGNAEVHSNEAVRCQHVFCLCCTHASMHARTHAPT